MDELERRLRGRVFALGLPASRELDLLEELRPAAEEIYLAAREEGCLEAVAVERALAVVPAAESFRGSGGGWRDVRFGMRLFARQPGLFAAAVMAMAVGIGASTAVFSALDAVVLRPLGYRESEKLALVWEQFRGGSEENVVAPANLLRWQARTRVFEQVSPVISMTKNLLGAGEPADVAIEGVSWDYLRMLGVEPVLGRDFVPDDDRAETPAAVLIHHKLWLSHFGGDRNVVGRVVRLDNVATVIVGVLPPGFRSLSEEPDMLTTARLDATRDYRPRGRYMRVAARLRADAGTAERELRAVARELEAEDPAFNKGWSVRVVPLREHFSRGARTGLWGLMAAVGLVLAIVLGNVANLLLGRAAAREREFAVRAALGASPARLMRQVLMESLVLAVCGGLAGVAVAWGLLRWMKTVAPFDIPRLEEAGASLAALVFLVLVVGLATVVCGLAPAWLAQRGEAAEALKEGSRGVAGSRRGRAWRSGFVMAQVAIAFLLLTAAGSLIGRFRQTLSTDPGFDPRGVLTMSVSLPDGKYGDPRRVVGFFAELERRLRAVPEVKAVGAVAWLPFAGPGAATGFWVPGREKPAPGAFPVADVRMATPGYFAAMRIALRRGRVFTERDAEGFVVSEALARTMFPGVNPVGQRLAVNMTGHEAPAEILGVVGDVRHASLGTEPKPMVYYPHAGFAMPWMTVVVRGAGVTARTVTAMVRELDPEQPVTNVRPMEEWIGRSVAGERFLASVLGVFALIALGLALMGIQGVLAQMVQERRHEIGVRVALGAEAGQVLWLIVRQGMALVAGGMAAGLLGSQFLARWLALPAAGETGVLMAVAVAIFGLAVIAWPARRALELDPLVVLRQE